MFKELDDGGSVVSLKRFRRKAKIRAWSEAICSIGRPFASVAIIVVMVCYVANSYLSDAGIHLFGDWIEIDAGSKVRLDKPVQVTIAEIVPGWTRHKPGTVCAIDAESLEAPAGLELEVIGKEPRSGDYLLSVGPNDFGMLARNSFCGASKIFVSQDGLAAIRHAAATQLTVDKQRTIPAMSARMSDCCR